MIGSINLIDQSASMESYQNQQVDSMEGQFNSLLERYQSGDGEASGLDRERLKELTNQMEGLLVNELLKQMRKTIPQSSLTGGGHAGEIFQSKLDQKYSDIVADNSQLGISEHIYESLTRRFPE